MPNAETHDFITVITAVAGNAAYFALAPKPEWELSLLFSATYLFAGYACAGDLDLDSKEYRRWGRLRFLWWPYRQIMPHRHPLSHGLVLGGVVRAFYLALVCTTLFWISIWLYSRLGPHVDPTVAVRAQWQSLFDFIHQKPKWAAALFSGFILAGTTHSITDSISTWFKRRF
jgi:uncharacterized metal-binding protein